MTPTQLQTAVFGGGCFWCTEAVFERLRGVRAVTPGYAGGVMTHPTYEDVSTGDTGHAEVIKIDFAPAEISYRDLLTIFFATHDPTTKNQQGADVGPQYRSIILFTTDEQRRQAEEFITNLNTAAGPSIVTEVKPLDKFYPAEAYHHDYYRRNQGAPYCQAVINPKLAKLAARFEDLLAGGKEPPA